MGSAVSEKPASPKSTSATCSPPRVPPSGAEVDFEYLVKDVQGRIAYTVAIERADVLYAGHTERYHQELRVTMMFRLERGSWKIIHRHADTMVELELPTPG